MGDLGISRRSDASTLLLWEWNAAAVALVSSPGEVRACLRPSAERPVATVGRPGSRMLIP